jgi:hypothetical protein
MSPVHLPIAHVMRFLVLLTVAATITASKQNCASALKAFEPHITPNKTPDGVPGNVLAPGHHRPPVLDGDTSSLAGALLDRNLDPQEECHDYT